jgi:hypothetical protein
MRGEKAAGNVIETSGDIMNYAAPLQNPAMLMISLINARPLLIPKERAIVMRFDDHCK